MYAQTNAPYPNRIQLVLGSTTGWGLLWGESWGGASSPTRGWGLLWGESWGGAETNFFFGPFVQSGPLGAFNPIRDLRIYVDGRKLSIQTYAFDAANSRYLMYADDLFNLQGVIQIVYHMPNPVFIDDSTNNTVPGFALLASYSPLGDEVLPPQASFTAIPSVAPANTPITLLWYTNNIPQIVITGNIGVGWGQGWGGDWAGESTFNTGFINTSTGGTGVFEVPGGFSQTTALTLIGYDALGVPLSGVLPLYATVTVV